MNKIECIRIIGDCISEIDILRGSLSKDTQERKRLDEKRDRLNKLQLRLVDKVFHEGAAEYETATKRLAAINSQVKATIKNVNKIAETLASLGKLAAAVDELLNLALPSIASLSASTTYSLASFARKRNIPFDELKEVFDHREALESAAEPETTRPDSSVVEKAPLLLVEEVLHGVELTPEKLIITVATGGCTNEGSFRFDVNKGTTGQMPYMVTVYRIEPDDCRVVLEPTKFSYSRKELGLDGAVEFVLRNKIGNTSQHRLVG